ncbi:hypothetical protein GQR60_15080 [Labilibaculum sp. A4]|uniref:hypothetical protein n=1 Tax=Labilibaculum euxinus TaxID=2686357 RepID=UPI000F61D953|nr:hypothetical protein [Labilibaculum euxinus]MDQ1770125.1 hypothetical protein [Labilibaculum euxinus]MWN77663.1 hypothetical protein [Labilibaculum euxinus]
MNNNKENYITQINSGNLYDLLIPKKEYGIIIFKLYEQLENKNSDFFSEDDITKLIILHKNNDKKEQKEGAKNVIRDLTEFFLKETDNQYRLTQYAKNFCYTIISKITDDLKPSEIELKLLYLKKTLLEHRSFDKWYSLIFTGDLTGFIESQLESLERQIINVIKKFRAGVNNDTVNGDVLVKNILENIEEINKQTNKIKGSLNHVETIKSIINRIDPSEEINPEQSLQNQKSVISFLDNLILDFERISKRIERVIPKLRQFYGNMTRLEFEKNTNKLLNLLLSQSQIIGCKPNWKLKFPASKNFCLERSFPYLPYKFCFVDNKRNLIDYKKDKREMYVPKPNVNEREIQRKVAEKTIKQRSKLFSFLEEIERELEYKRHIDFKLYFDKIINDVDDINIAVKIASILIRKYSKSKNYAFVVNQPLSKYSENKILWDMKIKKLS